MTWPIQAQEHPEDDYEDLLGAWLVERSRVVEAELLLTRARKLLETLADPDRGPLPIPRREIRRVIVEIDNQLG